MSVRPVLTQIWNFGIFGRHILPLCTIPRGKRWTFSETTRICFLTLFHMSLYLKKLYKHCIEVQGIPTYTLFTGVPIQKIAFPSFLDALRL